MTNEINGYYSVVTDMFRRNREERRELAEALEAVDSEITPIGAPPVVAEILLLQSTIADVLGMTHGHAGVPSSINVEQLTDIYRKAQIRLHELYKEIENV